jgi:hypothetical protein
MRSSALLLLIGFSVFISSDVFSQPMPIMKSIYTDSAAKMTVPFPDYPRPQLERQQWMNLNGKWDYLGGKDEPDPLTAKTIPSFDHAEKITVPYPPESFLSGIERKQEINMWYKRTFSLPDSFKGKRILLHFGAVDYHAVIFINHAKVATHTGGYESFTVDITDHLKRGENTLVVGALDKNDGRSVSGKNGPRGDYTFMSGIWQSVWLEPTAKVYIRDIRLTPDLKREGLSIKVHTSEAASVTAIASIGDEVVGKVTGNSKDELFIAIKNPVLWSPDHPFLYDLKIQLENKKGKVEDEVKSYFGMRSIALGRVNGVLRPLLNGKFVLQLGLLDQGYWPDGILTAPTDGALKHDIVLAKKTGFNLIRKHMKVEPQRWYYWCDKLGLLVWQDMPAIWYQNEDTATVRPQFRREWKEIIDQHYNAPSIITWVPFNENWGAFDVKEITSWTKRYDPSRLVDGNSGFNNNPSYQKPYGDPGNGDYVDTHIYVGPYGASVPDSHRAAALGEFGGLGLFVRGHMYPVANNAYDMMVSKEALTDRYVLLLTEVEQLMKYKGLSVAIYTQTTDVEHEINGLVTYDRAVDKMDFDKVYQINTAIIRSSKALNLDTARVGNVPK